MNINCDILIVGAGPAGASAAIASASKGVRTIVIEKKKEVGRPVKCGEAIGRYLLPLMPLEIPEKQKIWDIKGIKFGFSGNTIKRTGRMWSSFAVKRDILDKWLINEALKAGAVLKVESELLELKVSDDSIVKEAAVKTPNGDVLIKPKIVIGCDGVKSKVSEGIGLKVSDENLALVKSFEMSGLRLEDPDYDQIYTGKFAPNGFGYIFPKSRGRANVGVGVINPRKSISECFEEFLSTEEVSSQISGGKFVIEKSGSANYGPVTDNPVFGNVLLAGDSANQNLKPFVEGILPSIICGDLAGGSAADYVNEGVRLESYPARVKQKMGRYFSRSDGISHAILSLGDLPEDLCELLMVGTASGVFEYPKVKHLRKKKIEDIRRIIENECTELNEKAM